MSKKFLDIIGLSRLVSLIKNDMENKADNSSLESLRNETNNKIDIINTDLSTKPNTQTVAEMISRNAAAIIGSNAEMSVGFTLQSAAFQAILEPSHITCLETGPWYKINNGVPVQCGSESGVYVGENDVATVMMDETLFYFLDAMNRKYQRVKLGDPTKPFGALMLPSGEQIYIQSNATPTSLPTYIYAIADTISAPNFIEMFDNSEVSSVLFLGYINKIPAKVGAIEFYINTTIEEALEQDPVTTADLNFPTSQYYCTGAQTANSAPIWTLNSSFFDTNFTEGQFNTLNSGLTVEDKEQIATNKDDINNIKSSYAKFSDLSNVAYSGKYGDLIEIPSDLVGYKEEQGATPLQPYLTANEIMALTHKWGVVSQDIMGWIPNSFIDMWKSLMLEYNDNIGNFKVGLTELNYEQAVGSYNNITTSTGKLKNSNIYCAIIMTYSNQNSLSYRFKNASIEYVEAVNDFTAETVIDFCRSCTKLKRLFNPNASLSMRYASNTTNFFLDCTALEEVYLRELYYSLSIEYSPKLTLESVVYMIKKSARYLNKTLTNTFTLTLHATAYARCVADTTTYTWNDNTYNGIIALATAVGCSIVSA